MLIKNKKERIANLKKEPEEGPVEEPEDAEEKPAEEPERNQKKKCQKIEEDKRRTSGRSDSVEDWEF